MLQHRRSTGTKITCQLCSSFQLQLNTSLYPSSVFPRRALQYLKQNPVEPTNSESPIASQILALQMGPR